MHIYFSGIGGTGIGPLALIAHEAGFEVSGSDKQRSNYTDYLKTNGINLLIGQEDDSNIAFVHKSSKIDWFVYSSALPLENPKHPEILFANQHKIKQSKRDEFLNYLLNKTNLKLIAAAGTHGKTTSTAMLVWLFKELQIPISYSVGAKTSFCEMGHYNSASEYFVYECDEFDKNFLSFNPHLSMISSLSWDHHEIYKTESEYNQAFRQFVSQSSTTVIFQHDEKKLSPTHISKTVVLEDDDPLTNKISLPGAHNRKNARLCVEIVSLATKNVTKEKLVSIINKFPGTSRRFEKLAPNIYSDYAHTPEEIEATIQLASELGKDIVVVYEPLTDRRQHFMKEQYENTFLGAKKIYWLPSYLAREDPRLKILQPTELINYLKNKNQAVVAEKNSQLLEIILSEAISGATVVLLAGGGGNSLDEWARKNLATNQLIES